MPARQTEASEVLAAAGLVREGRIYRLAASRFPGMPLFPGHPPFQVLTFRSPHGICVAAEEPWGPGNQAGLGYLSELTMCTSHSGAHIDALADVRRELRVLVRGECARNLEKAVAFREDAEPTVFGCPLLGAADLFGCADGRRTLLTEAGDLDDCPAHRGRRQPVGNNWGLGRQHGRRQEERGKGRQHRFMYALRIFHCQEFC